MLIKISKFLKKDQLPTFNFCQSIYEEFGWDMRYSQDLKEVSKYFCRSRELFLITKDGRGFIIGCGGLQQLTRTRALLKRFYLVKAHRGKGVADLMLKKIIAFAKEENYAQIVLDTLTENVRAQRFFIRNGFRIYHPKPHKDWSESSAPEVFKFFKLNLRATSFR